MGLAVRGEPRGEGPRKQDDYGEDARYHRQFVATVAVPGGVPEARTGPLLGYGRSGSRRCRRHRHHDHFERPSRRTRGSMSTYAMSLRM